MTAMMDLRWLSLRHIVLRLGERKGWVSIFFFTILLAVFSPATKADTALTVQPEDATQLLYRMQQAAREQSYAGVYIFQQDELIRSSRLTYVFDSAGEHERLEILDGRPREYLRHNENLRCLIPDRKIVLIEWQGGSHFPNLRLGDPAMLTQYYKIRVEPNLRRVAGRQCQRIIVEPQDKLRYGYRFCADLHSNLLLKAQTLNAEGKVLEQVAFSSLRVGKDVDTAQLDSRWGTQDWEVKEVVMKPVDLAAQGWKIPAPQGFVVREQLSRSIESGAKVSQMVLSDGLAAISVFIEPYNAQSKHDVTLRRGATNVYKARVADFWLTVVGEVPRVTLQQLTQGIEYLPTVVSH